MLRSRWPFFKPFEAGSLRPLGRLAERTREVSESLLALTLILVMMGAWIADTNGIYTVSGTFMMVWRVG